MLQKSAVLFAAVIVACGGTTSGEGIGHPRLTGDTNPDVDLLPLAISEILLGDGGFVEIRNRGASTIVGPLSLCNDLACATATLGAAGLAPGERATTAMASLGDLRLKGTAGDLTLVDGDGGACDDAGVHAYAAWGGPPGSLRTTCGARAIAFGAWGSRQYVPTSYPAPQQALAFEDDAVGCAPPSPGAEATEITPCPQAAIKPALRLNEFAPTLGEDDTGWFEIANMSDEPLNLYGVRFCQPPVCTTLPDVDVPGKGYLAIAVGSAFDSDSGNDEGPNWIAVEAAKTLSATGELALLAPGEAVDAQAIWAYVEVGSSAGFLRPAAIDAGLWATTTRPADPVRIGGETLSRDEVADSSGEIADIAPWYTTSATNATPGQANGVMPAANIDNWSSCSAPPPANAARARATPIRLRQIAEVDDDGEKSVVIELTNQLDEGGAVEPGTLQINLSSTGQTYTVCNNPRECFVDDAPSDLTLEPYLAYGQSTFVVRLGNQTAPCPDRTQCVFVPSGAELTADGSATLLLDATPVQFISWGVLDEVDASDAFAAGVWASALPPCQLPPLGGDVVGYALIDGAQGHTRADYVPILQDQAL